MSFLELPSSDGSSQQSANGTYCASTDLMTEVASTCCASQSGRQALFMTMVATATFLSPLFYDIFVSVASIDGPVIAAVPSLMVP